MSERSNGLTPASEALDSWQASYETEIAERKRWWSERTIHDGAKEKGWRWALKLLPPDITRDEVALIEPSLDWAQERLEQCRFCDRTAGGGCDVDYYMRAGKGTRPVWNEQTRNVDFIRCYLDVEHQLRKRLAYFGIPPVLVGATFDNFHVDDALRDEVKMYVENFRRAGPVGYHFIGGVGSGKSHLAAAVVRALTQTPGMLHEARFEHVPSLFEKLRTNFDRPVEERDEFRQRIENCDLLVLDDLGAERPTDWVRDQLGIIVHMRWANMKPVFVTSNKSLDTYRDALGERAYSRLRTLVPFVRVIDGRDRR